MRRTATVSILLMLYLLVSIGVSAQEGKLSFTLIKKSNEDYVVYFNVSGITSLDHAEKVIDLVLNIPGVYDGRYFLTSTSKDRFWLKISTNVTPEQIRAVLRENSCDFDFSTVAVDGVILYPDDQPESLQISSEPYTPNIEGYPEFIDTGNPEKDKQDYTNRKREWISNNPEKYKQ
jgi:hypothetical protein